MNRIRAAFLTLLTLVLLGALSVPSFAEPPAPSPPPPKPSPLAPLTSHLNQQFQSFINGNPAAATTTSAPAAAPPAANSMAATTTSSENNGEEPVAEPSETFGTRALSLVIGVADLLAEQSTIFVDNFADLPQVSEWYNRQTTNPHLVDLWHTAGIDLLLVVGVAFAGGFACELLLTPARRILRRRKPVSIVRRITTAFGVLAVEILPVIIFIATSLTLLDQHETHKLPRFVVLNVIYAIALNRLVIILGGLLLVPRAETLRLIPLSHPQASYLFRWLRLYSFVTVYGYFCVDVARSLHVPAPAVAAFGSLLGLVLIVMTIIIIVQKRAYVAVLLRGHLSAAQRDLTPTQSLRLWLARSWHIIAIAYLVIGYMVTALSVQGGFAILLRGTILTFLVFAVMGLALHKIGRLGARNSDSAPQLHHTVLYLFLRIAVWILMIAGVAAAWGVSITALLATPFGQRLSGSLFSIGTTVVVLALIYGYLTTVIERHLNRKDKDGRPVPASARMRTLLPMLRNATLIVFMIVAGLVILSEAGLNIGPLLAGAGVIGVAIGFGSQTLVKDFLTGLFIVIENTIAIGDVVKIADHSGTVEGLSIRTLRLRDGDGGVHILPFSEVSQIINMTKDFAYALVTIGVAYDSNLRHVMDVMKAVGDEMQQDPKLRSSIIDPIEVLGVDSFGDSAIRIQARIRTRPGRQWDIKRALLLRLKERFDIEKIEIPFPTVSNIQKPNS